MRPATVQLTDRLPEIIDSVWEDLSELLRAYFVENGGDLPCLHDDINYSGDLDNLIDSAIPIYTSQLNELAYFHHDAAIAALIQTYGSADGDWPLGTFAAGLYQLISDAISERWNDDAEDLWDDWTDRLDSTETRKFVMSAWLSSQTAE